MKITMIETDAFEAMLSEFEHFVERMDKLILQHANKDIGDWLDKQDVCLLLNISPRTLQTLRDNGTLSFSHLGGKIFYKAEDVHKMLENRDRKK